MSQELAREFPGQRESQGLAREFPGHHAQLQQAESQSQPWCCQVQAECQKLAVYFPAHVPAEIQRGLPHAIRGLPLILGILFAEHRALSRKISRSFWRAEAEYRLICQDWHLEPQGVKARFVLVLIVLSLSVKFRVLPGQRPASQGQRLVHHCAAGLCAVFPALLLQGLPACLGIHAHIPAANQAV